MSIRDALHAVQSARRSVSAGIVAYPAKMADDITARLESELASWNLSLLRPSIEKIREMLKVVTSTDNATLTPPKFTPKVMEAFRTMASQIHSLGELKDVEKIYDMLGLKQSILSLSDFYNTFLPKAAMTRDMAKFSPSELEAVWRLLALVQQRGKLGGVVADRTAHAVKTYLDAVRRLERRRAEPRTEAGQQIDENAKKIYQESLEELEGLEKFYSALSGGKASKGIRREWEEPVDVADLPKSYPVDAVQDGTFKKVRVVLLISKKNRSFGGRWFEDEQRIDLVAPQNETTMSKVQFEALKRSIRSTIEHELQHMVQTIMATSLRLRERNRLAKEGKLDPTKLVRPKAAERAGTPYGPKDKIPKRSGNAASKDSFPRGNEKERYYLDPVEFYPQITTWVDRFKNKHARDVWNQGQPDDPVLQRWKVYVGMPKAGLSKDAIADVDPSPFYVTLHKFDRRLWRRAVAEGFRILTQKTRPPGWAKEALREKLKEHVDKKSTARALRAAAASLLRAP
jgi:hypothetical protein